MKKNDTIFSAMTAVSAILLAIVMTANINDTLNAKQTFSAPAGITAPADIPAESADNRASSESLRKKFEGLGLKLHEGKYWNEIK